MRSLSAVKDNNNSTKTSLLSFPKQTFTNTIYFFTRNYFDITFGYSINKVSLLVKKRSFIILFTSNGFIPKSKEIINVKTSM